MKSIFTLLFAGLSSLSIGQISNGVVAHFPFNGDVVDYSPSAIIATNNGPSAFVNGPQNDPNGAIHFVDTSTFVSFNDTAVKVDFPVSLSVWVKLDSIHPINGAPIFSTDNVFNDYHGYILGLNSSKVVAFSIGGGQGSAGSSNRRSFVTDDTITLNEWHHIAVIANAYNDMEIYVDCQPMSGTYSGSGPLNPVFSNTNGRIGRTMDLLASPEGRPMHGAIGELVMWNRAITAVEVGQLCSNAGLLGLDDLQNDTERVVIGIYDLLGRKTEIKPNEVLIKVYSDGTSEKVFVAE